MTTPEERRERIERYARGPELLRRALERLPAEALQWRPGPARWSAHEVVVHCADSETIAATRIRYLLGEDEPTIQGYDENRWAQRFDYHALPLELALAQVEQVRRYTLPLIRGLRAGDWSRAGRHTESGRYAADDWLRLYAEHLEIHARQIERNLAQWSAARAAGSAPAPAAAGGRSAEASSPTSTRSSRGSPSS